MNKQLLVNSNGPKTYNEFREAKAIIDPQENIVKSLLKEKAPQYTEIEVSFFQLCALHCKFCWQDNDNEEGIHSIREKSQVAIEYLKTNKNNLQPTIQVHMLGGELFEDSNDYYDEYLSFIFDIKNHCDNELPENELKFIFLTNMNFQKDETLRKLECFLKTLEESNCQFVLTTSWDPTGRPLAGETSTRFHHNITYFKKYLAEITFVLTKQTIKKILKGKNPYLDYLYNNSFVLDYDYYMPTTQVDSLMPNDWELLNAIRYLIKNYPNIRKLQAYIDNHGNPGKITCASLNKITILPDGTMTNCKHLDYEQADFETTINKESNASMILNFMSKKECLSCSYFADCPMSCFLMNDHKRFYENQQLDECLYKIIFRERDERKNTIPY